MRKLPTTRACFGCGRDNLFGLRLEMETDGQVVRTRFVPRPEHAGFKAIVHGGILATVLDELMAWACGVAAKQFAFCAELSVRFVEPARVGEELAATAEVITRRANKFFQTRAALRHAGRTVATATGKYLAMPASAMTEALADFDLPLEEIFQP